MLKKMIIHGLVAAAVIATAAAVYAEGRDSSYLSPNAVTTVASEIGSRPLESNGYLAENGQGRERHKSSSQDREHHDEKGMEHNRKHDRKHANGRDDD